MASLIKFCKIPTQIRSKNCVYLYNVVRNSATRDYAPGRYPMTEEEMAKAAEKYQLLREDYKPIPDDGQGLGDYPDLPAVSGDSKDPYYPWDYPSLKRNFGEPIHIHANIIGEDRWDCTTRTRWPMWVYWASFLGFMAGCAGIFWVGEQYKHVQPVARKQYPTAGVTHYTFEPLD